MNPGDRYTTRGEGKTLVEIVSFDATTGSVEATVIEAPDRYSAWQIGKTFTWDLGGFNRSYQRATS